MKIKGIDVADITMLMFFSSLSILLLSVSAALITAVIVEVMK